MTEPKLVEKTYLGDGVYADFDGFHVVLTTEDGLFILNRIYLDPDVLGRLNMFVTKLRAAIEAHNKAA